MGVSGRTPEFRPVAKRRLGAGVWTPVRKAEGTRKSPAKFRPVAKRRLVLKSGLQ
jgi:hypothetical protein